MLRIWCIFVMVLPMIRTAPSSSCRSSRTRPQSSTPPETSLTSWCRSSKFLALHGFFSKMVQNGLKWSKMVQRMKISEFPHVSMFEPPPWILHVSLPSQPHHPESSHRIAGSSQRAFFVAAASIFWPSMVIIRWMIIR